MDVASRRGSYRGYTSELKLQRIWKDGDWRCGAIGWGLGLGQLPDFYQFRANIAQNVYRPRPSFYRPVLPTRANSRAAQRATPRISPKLSSDTASLVQQHGLATQLRVALLARLLPLAHDLLVRARCNRLGRRQPAGAGPVLVQQEGRQLSLVSSLRSSSMPR